MSSRINIAKLLGDIRFWIVALALLRLVGITNPPLEVSHSWRQTTVAMVARNFYEVDANILYPRIDVGGDLSGITGMEFPLLNWLIALMAFLFGYADWYGRLINLVVSSVGCWYFYRILKRFFGERHAFCATIILCVSLWFAFARKMMPDTFSMSLVMMGMYYGVDYLFHERRRIGNLLGYILLTMAGVLSKLPSGYILIVFLLPIFDRTLPLRRKAWFVVSTVALLLPVVWWYFLWVPHLVETYGIHHFFMGEGLGQGLSDLWNEWGLVLKRFYATAILYTGFAVFVVGLFFAFLNKQKMLLRVVALSAFAFLLVMLSAGWTFIHHDYYMVPFVPVMALVAGYGVAQVSNAKWRTVLLTVVALENILNHHSQFIIHENRRPLLALESVFDGFSSRNDLVCINSGFEPTVMYFTHRKGWVADNSQLQDEDYLVDLQRRGCKYVLVMKRAFGTDVILPYEKVFESDDYTIYRLL
ncbi:MAG: glycosyltransferase family 39 protein [Bacteroidales bacterium]|nr:glycosyltransferase family 39 protein [Bacteroidales bacterium]